MISKLLTLLLITIGISPLLAQDYDEDYFRSPVDHVMRLSGSFAELRTNHFHMGIDIKSTNGRPGDPILAAADGYVSRINVDASGYGNALYIDHPNGYTTVYAHLSAFEKNLAEHINTKQHESKTFQQQLYPDSLFYVTKGDIIGYMGNTGKSFGPHLHFEIRETDSETPVNPFLFGLKPSDNRPPVFQAIKFYKSDSTGNFTSILEKKIKLKSKGLYTVGDEIIIVPTDQIAISVQVYDQMDGAYNKNGVYLMKLLVNDQVQHGYKLDRVSYEEGHFINSFIDYGEKQMSKRQFSNCFTHPVDQLSIYEHKPDRSGMIKLQSDKATNVKIVLQDFHGNESEINLKLKSTDTEEIINQEEGNYNLQFGEKNIIRLPRSEIIFDEASFLNNKLIHITEGSGIVDGHNLPDFHIGKATTPIFKPYELYIKGLSIPDSLKTHFCLVKCGEKSTTALKGVWQDSIYFVEMKSLGSYQCSLDMTPPKIEVINLKRKMTQGMTIKFKITDELEPASKKDRLRYVGKIDGKWVLFKYDLKNELIYHTLDDKHPPGEHILHLSVNDNRGNKSTFSYQFTQF